MKKDKLANRINRVMLVIIGLCAISGFLVLIFVLESS